MTQQTMYPAKVNSPQTELSAAINASVTSITVTDASAFPAGPNLAVIGNDETAETILYTSITSNTLNGVTRGFQSTAKSWSLGAKVARYFTAYDHDAFRTNILDLANRYNGLARQALINGNFDIAQRGTSFSNPASGAYTLDRWVVGSTADGGTFPTLTHSRQAQTPGAVPGSFYFYRVATSGAGTSLGTSSFHAILNLIENGTRYLCGAGKQATLSLWARSSIANKKLGIKASQRYGSGGSPSSIEFVNGTYVTLTSTWTQYTWTFTTNTLSGKVFGTNNDDVLGITIMLQWGATQAPTVGDTVAESFVGAGDIDIAQVQLCAGDVALPFWPKSYDEELRACQRYFEVFDSRSQSGSRVALGVATVVSTTTYNVTCNFKTAKRVVPTLVQGGGGFRVLPGGAITTVNYSDGTRESANLSCSGSGLTLNQSAIIQGVDGSTSWIGFDAEL